MIAFTPAENTHSRWGYLTWFCLWAGVTSLALSLTPNPDGFGTHRQLGLPACPSITIFGRPCPACGLTTAFSATVRGNLSFAFYANPFGPIFYFLFTLTALLALYAALKKQIIDTSSRWVAWGVGLLLTAYLGYGVWRFVWGP